MARQKIGIFGGTFNPVHIGHLRLALEVQERAGLDRVEFLPASVPPHKSAGGVLPFDFRVQMLRCGIQGISGLGVNELEASLPSPSFTCNTVDALLQNRKEKEPYFLLGSNDLPDMIHWEQGYELPQRIHFIIVERSASLASVMEFARQTWPSGRMEENRFIFSGGIEMLFLSIPRLAISSTLVRKKWMSGQKIDFLVSQKIQKLLLEHKEEVDSYWSSAQE